jgi:hypothetical protein
MAGMDGAAMEEPLLTAVIADEPEAPIPYEPLDGTVRHVDNLRGPSPDGLSTP